jgi:putative membrane protein
MMFLNIFWILLLIGGAILFLKYLGRATEGDQKIPEIPFLGSSAMDILKKRYARGEIDNEEFERRKQHLEAADAPRVFR